MLNEFKNFSLFATWLSFPFLHFSLLFSQSLLALDMIEDHLSYTSNRAADIDADKDVLGTWIKGLDYFRMDGTTSVDFRKSYIDMFNDPTNDR